MKNLGKWVLSAAVLAGAMGLGTATANAAQIGVGVYVHGGPVAYVLPAPDRDTHGLPATGMPATGSPDAGTLRACGVTSIAITM